MKFTKSLLAAMLLLATAAMLPAAITPWQNYSTGGTDVSTTLCYSVITANSYNGAAPVVTFLNATSDKAASVVQFYSAGAPVTAISNSTVTIALLSATNASTLFTTNGGVIIIKHNATDTYERRVLTSSSAVETVLVVTSAPTTAIASGDEIWPMTTAGFIPCGAATTLSLVGNGIYSGQPGKPLLLEVDGTSSCQINAVSATFR